MPTPKEKILQLFPRGVEVLSVFHDIEEEEYHRLLDAVESSIPFADLEENYSLRVFLYAGCLKFDRWTVPTPFVISPEQTFDYQRFVNALIKAEGKISENTPTFLLRIIKSELYSTLDCVPFDKIDSAKLQAFRNRIMGIPAPSNTQKFNQFDGEKQKITAIIDGVSNKDLRTIIITQLPYIIHTQPLSVKLSWKGIPVKATITPTFYQNESMAVALPFGQPLGPTRWQSGITHIELELQTLVDCDMQTPSLLVFDSHELPIDGWPKALSLAFSLIHDVSWILRVKHSGEQQWIIAPRDLAQIENVINTASFGQIDWKIKQSPAVLMKGFDQSGEILHIDMGEVIPLAWHTRCRSLAKIYLEIGETNEALFWLNVGIEALFKMRFEEILQAIGKPELTEELDTPKVFWDPADEIVTTQFPELAGKIQWPDTQIHVSMYSKIKYFYKQIPMKTSVKEVLSYYNCVSKYRNALFHGTDEQRSSTDIVKEAMRCFDWLEENVILAGSR